ncbi:unnamed protein product [Caenorhabditis auriculariae]|uniref:Uncharacterized protein n=1 Tax=Caenorhabditis auriculariae TaxID=2777116 RepID=A0A8S1HBY9_9PELO|nr:unnamed protein product [Caenorhabditis auriculariae]
MSAHLARASFLSTRISTRQASSHAHDQHAVWRTINKLGSEGKWDNINNKPKLFLFGQAKKDTYAAYGAINRSTDFFQSTPYGPYMKVIWRLALLLGTVQAGVILYEWLVPEQKRLQYKHRHHGHHGEHH